MLNFNLELSTKIPKTKAERLKCVPGILFFSSVITQCDEQGLLSIDDTLDQLKPVETGPWKNPSVKFAARVILQGIVDGQSIDQIERSAEALCCAAGFQGADLLDLIVVVEAARVLLGRNSLWVFRDRCNVWTLGDIADEIGVDSKIDAAVMTAEIEAFIAAKRASEPDGTEIDDLIARLDNRAIQMVLRELDGRDLTFLLKTVTSTTARSLVDGMSPLAATLVIRGCRFVGDAAESYLTVARTRLIDIVETLERDNEILYTA